MQLLVSIPSCRVAMEACGTAHYGGRQLEELGHQVLLIPPDYVRPFMKRQKNDVADAEAIAEAAQRPDMRFCACEERDVSESDSKRFQRYPYLARRLVSMRMWAMVIHASAEATDLSKSLASLRHRPSQAKVRSTTQRRGRISKPWALSERLMISSVHFPIFCSRFLSLSPA